MKNGFAYRHQFKNIEQKLVTTLIYDTTVQVDDAADVIIEDIETAGDPLRISIVDNDEDKLTPIKARKAVIKFLSSSNVGLSAFADGPSDRFYVTIQIESQFIFYGYLVLADNREAFLPPTNVVILTASDKLGALKTIALTDDAGLNPSGNYNIATLIALCLKKTKLSLPIKVINNIRHGSGQKQYQVLFSSVSQTVVVSTDDAFFYIGQEIDVTGTANNNGTYVIQSVTDGLGVKVLTIDATIITSEAGVTATITDNSSLKHFYDAVYLDSKTFEDKIGSSEDCYTVLEKILGEDCFLTQWQGQWWIMRVDELDGNPAYAATFDKDGLFVQFESPANFDKAIGYNESLWLSDEQTQVTLEEEHGFVKETFRFVSPQEIICNIDFERGDYIGDIDADNKKYKPECWTHSFEPFNPEAPVLTPDNEIYIQKRSHSGYEIDKFLVITNSTNSNYLISEPMPVHTQDKVSISFDYRWNQNKSGSGTITVGTCYITLTGNNGNDYYLHADGRWKQTNGSWGTNSWDFSLVWVPNDVDETENRTVSIESKEIPTDGNIRISFISTGADPAGIDDVHVYITSLSVQYLPYISGSFQRYTSQYNRIDRTTTQYSGIKTTGYLAKRDEEVFINDSPKKVFKGALQLLQKHDLLYNGSIIFATGPDRFQLPGNQTALFPAGTFFILDSVSFGGIGRVESSSYAIIGNTTVIIVSGLTFTTVTENGTIHSTIFNLTTFFYTAHAFGGGFPPDPTYCHPYGYIQAFSVWNQYRNACRVFQYKLQGDKDLIGFGEIPPDLINKFLITDTSSHSNSRVFMLLTFEHDLFLCESHGTLVEVYNSVGGKLYGDVFSFKYQTD